MQRLEDTYWTGRADADYEAIGAEQAALEDRIAAADAWNLERNVDIAMDALRCPPDDADVTTLSGGEKRRVALVPAAAPPPRPAAPRRADQPPRRRVGRLARTLPPGVRRHRRRDHPRPVLPRQRRAVDPRARPRPGHPVRGQLLVVARAEAGAPGRRAEGRSTPASGRSRASSNGCACPRAPGRRRARPGSARTRSCSPRRRTRKDATRELEIAIPPGPRLGDHVIEVKDLRKALRRQAAHRRPDVLAAAGRDRRDHRRQRGRQDDAVPDDPRPGAGRPREHHHRRHRPAELRRPGARRPPGRHDRCSTRSPAASSSSRSATASCRRAPTSRASTSGAPTSRSASATLSGGERNRVHLAKLLKSGGNVLLLDEPTNDLDVDTLRALEAGLESFPGCAVVISHDRWFLDRIATHVPGLRGRQPGALVRGQLHRVRGVPPPRARHGRRPAAPDPLQAPRYLIRLPSRVGDG